MKTGTIPGMQTIYLIDGSAYIYRAYHAIAPLSNSKGMPTHAVLGFVNMVNRLIKDKDPSHLAIAFDGPGPVFRHEMYADYKANRPPMPEDLRVQLPYIRQFVSASRILMLEEKGVEADDLIASAVGQFVAQGLQVVLVSGDKDLLQLVGDRVVMWDPMKDKIMDREAVVEKYGVPPEQLLDLFALIGDSSDNVPGVPGVGPKTAQKLIATYGSLDGLYENTGALKKSKMTEKIIANQEQAYLSKDLIALRMDADVPAETQAYQFPGPDDFQLQALYEEMEFSSLLKGLDTALPVETDGFHVVNTSEALKELVSQLSVSREIVVDVETTSLNPRRAELVGVSCAVSLETAWYIPLGHLKADGQLADGQLDAAEVKSALLPVLESADVTLIGHNLKYDYAVLARCWNFAPKGRLADTMLAAYLTESGGRSLKLDSLCLERGVKMTSFEEVVNGDKREDCFAYVPVAKAVDYSCEDVYGTLFLWKEFAPLLTEKGVQELFEQVEMPILPILAGMEADGIGLDDEVLRELSAEFSAKIEALEQEIYRLVGHPFNINSPKQLGEILFEELGLPHGRKTKTGYSTDVKVLEKLAPKHELPALILRYRSFAKLLSTYVDKLALLKDPQSGRIHTSFNQAVTATGRLSSSDPNLQNIPNRSEEGGRIREAFIPREGKIFLSADYSQIDLRVLAHYSQDQALLDAFRHDYDIHARTAAEIFGVAQPLVTSEMRRVAKSINFGIVYGMSAFGLSSQLNITRKDAQRFIDRYFGLYSGVQSFMTDVVVEARKNGYVTTLLGRRRTVADIDSTNRVTREFAERMAINTPIQGTAADIIKLAMIGCNDAIEKSGLDVKMLLQIHDELVFELAEEDLEVVQPLVRLAMEDALKLDVPLKVNFVVGHNLAKE